jgi:hypothetical protein
MSRRYFPSAGRAVHNAPSLQIPDALDPAKPIGAIFLDAQMKVNQFRLTCHDQPIYRFASVNFQLLYGRFWFSAFHSLSPAKSSDRLTFLEERIYRHFYPEGQEQTWEIIKEMGRSAAERNIGKGMARHRPPAACGPLIFVRTRIEHVYDQGVFLPGRENFNESKRFSISAP